MGKKRNALEEVILNLFSITKDPCLHENHIIAILSHLPEKELKDAITGLKQQGELVAVHGDDESPLMLREAQERRQKRSEEYTFLTKAPAEVA